MGNIKLRVLQLAQISPFLIWIISLAVFAWFIKSPAATDFWINVIAGIFIPLFSAIVALSFVLLRNLPDRLRLYNLLRAMEDSPILIFVSKIVLPSGNGYTFNGPLRFGGNVIALEEYFAAYELGNFLSQDVLASYPAFLRNKISKLPRIRPIISTFQISPWDEYTLKECIKRNNAVSIISLGSPGSNWVTAYVSEYFGGEFRFDTGGEYVEVVHGTSNEKFSLDDYKDVGIIQRVTLHEENYTVIILAGLSDYSTKMCVMYFLKNWRQIALKYEDGIDFGICLVVPLDNPEAYDQPIEIRTYPQRS